MVVSGKMFEMWAICVKRFCSNLPQQVLELLDSYNFDKTELAQLEKKSRTRSCGSRLQLCWNLQSEQYNTPPPEYFGWAWSKWGVGLWGVVSVCGGFGEMVGMMHVRPRADAPPNSSSQGCPRRWPNGQSAVQNTQQNWSSLIWIKMKTTNTKYWFKPQGCLG